MSTAAPEGGSLVSGVNPNRDNSTFPDIEQKKREQARQEHDWAEGRRASHPSYTRNGGPDVNPGVVGESNKTRQESVDAGETEGVKTPVTP